VGCTRRESRSDNGKQPQHDDDFGRAFYANAYVLLVHHKIAFPGLFDDVGENGVLIRFRDQFRAHFYGQASREKYSRAIELEPALLQWVDQYNSSHRFRGWPTRQSGGLPRFKRNDSVLPQEQIRERT
jgi:hypothetical protein